MSPFEHGEVFVLDDGGEADLDLGNYERFLGVRLSRDHNITTGKVRAAPVIDPAPGKGRERGAMAVTSRARRSGTISSALRHASTEEVVSVLMRIIMRCLGLRREVSSSIGALP